MAFVSQRVVAVGKTVRQLLLDGVDLAGQRLHQLGRRLARFGGSVQRLGQLLHLLGLDVVADRFQVVRDQLNGFQIAVTVGLA